MSVYQELGAKLRNFMLDKTEEVDDKIEAIDKHERYVNTELDYGVFEVTDMTFNDTTPLVFSSVINGNMKLSENGYIKLRAGKTYIFHTGFYTGSGSSNDNYNIGYFLVDSEMNVLSDAQTSSTGSHIYQASEDIEVTFISDGFNSHVVPAWSCVNVHEINRQIVIDPVEHVNDSQGIEDTPVGHIIAHMGTVAPKHYLICDGTEYNIADYPYLAQHIEDNFGSIDFFGGDGETTFAVPDLRGEFLRGTGTGTRDSGTGGEVGEHQDGTKHVYVVPGNTSWVASGDEIKNDNMDTKNGNVKLNGTTTAKSGSSYIQYYTSRPTNTAVLYCIKYEPTYFMNTYNTNYMQPSLYSEEERVVGCWINGKPIYERTIIGTIPAYTPEHSVFATVENMEHLIQYCGVVIRDTERIQIPYVNGTTYFISVLNVGESLKTVIPSAWKTIVGSETYLTIQYTKTTDEENSFTNDMLKDSYVELTYSDEEISTMVSDILGGEE